MRKILSAMLCLILAASAAPRTVFSEAEAVTITEASGWFESAYAEWSGAGIDTVNAYIKPEGGEYAPIDRELLREYKNGTCRVDAVGLSAGSYRIKIVPAENGAEDESLATETEILSVGSYPREGFAFSSQSPEKDASGGYKPDGTPKDGADIIYVSNGNKDRVMIDDIPKDGIGLVSIFDFRERNKITTPLIVRLIGRVDMPEGMQKYLLGIRNTKNVTIEGVGEDAAIHGWGITFKESSNIELRNFAIMWYGGGTDSDATALDGNNDNIWIHNLEYFYGAHGPDSDQSKGDGSIDMKNQSDYVTISYNHFWDSGKTTFTDSPDGASDKTHVTYHHNHFDHSDSRHPRCVGSDVHMYNNYYDGVSKYGIGAAKGSCIFAENNYFRYCARPMIISSQGSDVYNSSKKNYSGDGTLSGQAGGMIKAFGNHMGEYERFYTQLDTPSDLAPGLSNAGHLDCYLVSDRDEKVPDTVKALKGGAVYDNFDTAADMYEYSAETAESAVETVKKYAGRMNGGDFEYTFDNSIQDKNYDTIPELQTLVENYDPPIAEVGGDASLIVEQPPEPSDDRITHNFTTQGTASGVFEIKGSITDLFGIMRYDAVNLTKSLKFEGSSYIKFTAVQCGIMTLLANPYRGSVNVKVNNEVVRGDPETGLIQFNVEPGETYNITRDSVSYLFYLILEYDPNSPMITPHPTQAPTSAPTAKPGNPTQTPSGGSPDIPASGGYIHNFTESDMRSDFYTISGATSKDRGSLEYSGMTLTNAFKLGSSSHISFAAPGNGEMLLVFGSSSTPTAKINGTALIGSGNTLTFPVEGGESYEITKNSGEQLIYYMALTLDAAPTDAPPTEGPAATTEPSDAPSTETPTEEPKNGGYSIKGSDSSNSGLTAAVEYSGTGAPKATLLAAKYKNGALTAFGNPIELNGEGEYLIENFAAENGENIVLYIWNDTDKIKPLCEKFELNNN